MKIINNILYEVSNKDIIDGTVKIPNSIKVIDKMTIENRSNLTHLEIPEGVKKIEDFAFAWCENLRLVKFPSSLKYIGSDSFKLCNNLKIVNVSSCKTLNILKGNIKLLALNSIIERNVEFNKKEFINYLKKHKDFALQMIISEHLNDLFNFMLNNDIYTYEELYSTFNSIIKNENYDAEIVAMLLNIMEKNRNNITEILDDKYNLDDDKPIIKKK